MTRETHLLLARSVRSVAAALVGVLAFGTVSHAAPAIDNSNASVSCTSIAKGVIKARPALTATGGTSTVLLLSGKLGGCSSPEGITFQEGRSTFRAILNVTDNACAGFVGESPTTGSITIRWKTDESLTNPISTVTLPSGAVVGGTGTVAGGLRVTFDLGTGAPSNGAAMGATPMSVTGGFTGGDGGASSGVTVVTQLSVDSILALCDSRKGTKEVGIGAGAVSLH